jgi:hypothetical protein
MKVLPGRTTGLGLAPLTPSQLMSRTNAMVPNSVGGVSTLPECPVVPVTLPVHHHLTPSNVTVENTFLRSRWSDVMDTRHIVASPPLPRQVLPGRH